METKIIISSNHKKALAFFEKLHEKKQEIKKKMQDSPIAARLRINTRPR